MTFPLALCLAVLLPFALTGAALLILGLCRAASGTTVDEGESFGGQYDE